MNLTHTAVATNISQREALLPVRRDGARLLCIPPLFHVYASATCLHNMAYAQGTLVILPRYTARRAVLAVAGAGERISVLHRAARRSSPG